ncbi:MAG: high frequency lysogenization protein HflD [Pseudomonadota bacterium]
MKKTASILIWLRRCAPILSVSKLSPALFVALLLGAMTLVQSVPAQAQSGNLLGRGTATETPAEAPTDDNSTGSSVLPDWLSPVVTKMVQIQSSLNREMTAALRSAREAQSWWPGLTIIGLSFAYGVFHAAGPGHGKMVTTTYFLSRDAGWKQGVTMGTLIAAVQAVSAIVLVGTFALVLNLGPASITRNGLIMEAVSYGLIIIMGAVMCLRIVQGRDDCCDHGPAEQAHDHSHNHDHDHHHAPTPYSGWRQTVISGVIVGLRPCTGSILMLLFTLANGLIFIGIVSAFAMAIGVAITISLIGLAAIGMRSGTRKLFSLPDRVSNILRRTIGFAGAGMITLFGVLLLLSSAQQLGWL